MKKREMILQLQETVDALQAQLRDKEKSNQALRAQLSAALRERGEAQLRAQETQARACEDAGHGGALLAGQAALFFQMDRYLTGLTASCRETLLRLSEERGSADVEALFSAALSATLARGRSYEERQQGELVLESVEAVRRLGVNGLRHNRYVTRAVLPEGLEELSDSFFCGCVALREVVLPATLRRIGDYAFFDCGALETVTLPEDLQEIGEFAFGNCGAIDALSLPLTVRRIGKAAFRGCAALRALRFHRESRLQELGSHAFQNCTSLRQCALPSTLQALPTSLFYGCSALERSVIPASVRELGSFVYWGCTALREIVIENANTLLPPDFAEGLPAVRLSLAESGRVYSLPQPLPEVPAESAVCEG